MLTHMIEVHSLARPGKTVARQVPNPSRPVGYDQHFMGPTQTVTHRLGPQLLFERFDSSARHGVPPAQNDGTPAGRLGALAQTKTSAAISPMPPARFLAFLPDGLALPPIVPFPDVPSVQFQHQGERLQGQLELQVLILLGATFGLPHLLID